MPRTRSHGFTLVEMMISLLITVIVAGGAFVAMRTQQRGYQAGRWTREAQDAARRTVLALDQRVRHAGLGVDPALALDFSYYGIREGWPDAALCPPEMGNCPRDATANTDELVFYVRDPAFVTRDPPVGHAWAMSGATNADVKVTLKPGDAFGRGQILVAICRDPNRYAYFTVSTTARYLAPTGAPPKEMTILLENVDPGNPFRRQDLANEECFATAYVYKVDRYRFHVRPVRVDAARFEPYLVLDMGVDRDLDTFVDTDDEILVARGIEMFQVSYLMPNGLTAGDSPGEIQFQTAQPGAPPAVPSTYGDQAQNTIWRTNFPLLAPTLDRSVYYPSSWFPKSLGSAERQLNAQGNIRAVRIGIVARSESVAPEGGSNIILGNGFTMQNFVGSFGAPAWLAAGRPANGDDRFVRARVEITIPLPNLNARAMSL